MFSLQRRAPCGFACRALAWISIASRLAASLKVSVPPPPQPVQPPNPYDKNGLDWTQGMCGTRERQSPVNFDDHIFSPPSDILKYSYKTLANVQLKMYANMGLISVDLSDLPVGSVQFNGADFPLIRIDFHANAEHLFRGERNAMEIQLVHRKENDPTRTLIIAIPVWSEKLPQPPKIPLQAFLSTPLGPWYPPDWREPDFNAALQTFLTVRPPTTEGQAVPVVVPLTKPLDLSYFVENPAIVDSGTFIQYTGSLTTPPCTDSATWFVRRKPMLASSGQTAAFADSVYRLTNMHGNFRGPMPVNYRGLKVFRAQWVMYTQPGVPKLPLGPNARTDKEFQAEKLSEQANELSRDALDYMGDFSKRLRRSAHALENQLNKLPPMTTPPPNDLLPNQWQQAVLKMQGAMSGIVNGVMNSVDKSMRAETMQVHKKAAREAQKARDMTMTWTAAAMDASVQQAAYAAQGANQAHPGMQPPMHPGMQPPMHPGMAGGALPPPMQQPMPGQPVTPPR